MVVMEHLTSRISTTVKKLFQNEIDDNQINIFKTLDIRSENLLNPNIDNNDNFLISTEENIKKY